MDVTASNYDQTLTRPAPQPVGNTSQSVVPDTAKSAGHTEETTGHQALKTANTTAAEKDKSSVASMSKDAIEKAIEQVNKSISTFNREMHVSVHQKTQRIMVKVLDTEENKVIRELPPEKVLDAFAQTLELAGILVDKKS